MSLFGPAERTELLARWTDPARAYHGERHLQECLEHFQRLRALAHDPDAVEAALWLHDIIYIPTRDDNEEQSAAFTRDYLARLGVAPARIANIETMIRATAHDRPATTADARLVCDIDLAILGATDRRFDEYERDIRAEYAWVPYDTFRRRRMEILTGFLARPQLYQTEYFGARLEWKARLNLSRAIAMLRSDTPAA